MVVSALLSAVLANDIVCLASTPVLTVALLQARPPLPIFQQTRPSEQQIDRPHLDHVVQIVVIKMLV